MYCGHKHCVIFQQDTTNLSFLQIIRGHNTETINAKISNSNDHYSGQKHCETFFLIIGHEKLILGNGNHKFAIFEVRGIILKS